MVVGDAAVVVVVVVGGGGGGCDDCDVLNVVAALAVVDGETELTAPAAYVAVGMSVAGRVEKVALEVEEENVIGCSGISSKVGCSPLSVRVFDDNSSVSLIGGQITFGQSHFSAMV